MATRGPLYQHFYRVLARHITKDFIARVEARLRSRLRDLEPQLSDTDPWTPGVSIDLQTMIDLLHEVAEEELDVVSG